jgi:hypothetical protein
MKRLPLWSGKRALTDRGCVKTQFHDEDTTRQPLNVQANHNILWPHFMDCAFLHRLGR